MTLLCKLVMGTVCWMTQLATSGPAHSTCLTAGTLHIQWTVQTSSLDASNAAGASAFTCHQEAQRPLKSLLPACPLHAVSERVVRYIKLQADILNCTYSFAGDRVPNINFYEFTLQVRPASAEVLVRTANLARTHPPCPHPPIAHD